MNRFIRKDRMVPLCACGCGERVKWCKYRKQWNKFIYGHTWKGKKLCQETCEKMSASLIGKKHSSEHKKNNSLCRIGKKASEETKRKMSELRKGRDSPMLNKKHSEEAKRKISIAMSGEKHPWFGRKHSRESRKKMSVSLSGKNHPLYGKRHSRKTLQKMAIIKLGSNNPAWKGGKSFEPYCHIWTDKEYKQSIKDRDNNKCQNPDCWHTADCFSLAIHHIKHDKKKCDPWDLITVCKSCNARAESNMEYWEKLYQDIMTKKYGYVYNE